MVCTTRSKKGAAAAADHAPPAPHAGTKRNRRKVPARAACIDQLGQNKQNKEVESQQLEPLLGALCGAACRHDFAVQDATYRTFDDLRRDGLYNVVDGWYGVEGAPHRAHRAVPHSFNSINKHAGGVRIRSVRVMAADAEVAVLHAIFGDADVAWVFLSDATYFATIDAEMVTYAPAFDAVARLQSDDRFRLEVALYGAAAGGR
jgi:hypothetical protein